MEQVNTTALLQRVVQLETDTNNFFLIINGFIIFLMQLGFAFFEAGNVRTKNVTNILIKNYVDIAVGGISYWAIGYSFAYGASEQFSNVFIGLGSNFLIGVEPEIYAQWFFQYVFAATAATIVSGAVAERTYFVAYLVYSVFMTGFIYPVATHWGWSSNGWLVSFDPPYMDFAGSGFVHVIGGCGALIGAIAVGPRIGKFDEYGEPVTIIGSSTFLSALGGLILWFGFLAFNGGSALSVTGGMSLTVSAVVVNTVIAGCAGATSGFIIGKFVHPRRFQLSACIAGNISGMVAICAGVAYVSPASAFLIGFIAAGVDKLLALLVLKLKIDDPLDAVGVHLGAGSWGIIAASLFSKTTGVFYGHGFAQFGVNLLGLISISSWTLFLSILIFGILKATNFLRVSERTEIAGLDYMEHLERAFKLKSSSTSSLSESRDSTSTS